MKGARGILINITGSSKLSLHDVNEACALIRAAAEYEDVQINFGIVLDEALEDEVKITVIATGFQRAGLPAIRPGSTSEQVLERATEPRYNRLPTGASRTKNSWRSRTTWIRSRSSRLCRRKPRLWPHPRRSFRHRPARVTTRTRTISICRRSCGASDDCSSNDADVFTKLKHSGRGVN